MAIYHCSVRTFSRSDNRSAVAASAYRSGSVLKDERTGQSHNYRNRKGIVHALVLLPPNAPAAYTDRFTLWNAAESAERKKNARVAREVILALPHELSEGQRLSLTKDMALFLVEKYGVAVDMAIHAPLARNRDDPRNHHAHLLFTTRVVKQDGLGEKTRILDDLEQGPIQIELIRQVWETLANDALQQAGFKDVRIDRRTLEAQGIDRIPQEHVGKAGTHADEEETARTKRDDEEDEDGETDTGKGKAGSGDSMGQAPSADKKNSSPSKQKPATKEKRFDRLTLNEEIKRLNAERAAFSPIPFKYKIKELDRLMDRLDGRVQRLKLLSEKSSLPARVLSLVKSAINIAKSLIGVRMKDEAALNLRAAEREAKAERQRARYGRTYRAHLSERMEEMRENMEMLQRRRTQHQNYKAFVELVEGRVKLVYSTLKSPALPARTEWKIAIEQELKAKIRIEGIKIRDSIPIEYRPTMKQEALVTPFNAALKNSASAVALDNSIASPEKEKIIQGLQEPKRSFTPAVDSMPSKDNADRAVWHKEVIVKIKSLDETRAARVPISTDTPRSKPFESSTVWKIEANERGRSILGRMQADIRERKVEMPKANDEGFSGRFNHPTKIITETEVIQKVRTEANTARAKVPPDLRAEPYSEHETPDYKVGFSGAWDKAAQPEPKQPKPTMGSKFNQAAGPKTPHESAQEQTPDNKP